MQGLFSLGRLRARSTELGWFMILMFSIEGLVFILAPFWAYSWAGKPFPGFVVEQTLVVANYGGEGWSGRSLGMNYPQRVISLRDRAVSTPDEFLDALSSFERGDAVAVHVIYPDGERRFYPAVPLIDFPQMDLLRLFWVPYLVGLAFFIMGVWVFRVRGYSPSSRAFSYFSMSAALSSALLFDLITTHNATFLWFLAVTQHGSALTNLALRFPEDWIPARGLQWLRYLSYALSAGLTIWGLAVLYDTGRPWAYVTPWRVSYFYAAFGILFFLGIMLYRLKTASSRLARQQTWVILIGSLVAFTPIAIFLLAPMAGMLLPFITVLFLPFLLFFPLSISIAILRFRLWDIDLLINRTMVYGALTLLLGGIYLGSIIFLQTIFIRVTGESSPFTIALSTLVIAVMFNPLRRRLQSVIDQRFFRRKYEAAQALAAFSTALRREVDLERLSQKLIGIIQETVQPAHTVLLSYQADHSGLQAVVSEDDPFWKVLLAARQVIDVDEIVLDSPGLDRLKASGAKLIIPLVSQGELVGLLNLGPRLGDQYYTNNDIQLLEAISGQAAPALRVAHLVYQQQIEAQERQRLDHELRVARFIQHMLLPKQLPEIAGWKIFGHYQPAQAVGGDFFDFIRFENGTLGIVIGDATGHGIPAALVMASARSMVRAIALQLASASDVLRKANELLLPAMPQGMFVTCLYAVVDPKSGLIRYANAGHNLPCLLSNGDVVELRATGMPLGLLPEMDYEEKQAFMQPGDCVVFYSDGLVEAHNAGYEMFGVPRLKQLLCKIHNQSGVIDNLLAEWRDFNGMGREQEDDMTLVTVQWISERRPELESRIEAQGFIESGHSLANAG